MNWVRRLPSHPIAVSVVGAFAESLRSEVDLERLQSALIDTTGNAVRPAPVSVWLRPAPNPTP